MNFGKNALEFSKEQIVETEKDMKNLHITDADVKTKASEYINKIIEFVQKLIDNGHAYATDKGDVYFSVKTFPEYGKLSHRKVDEMLNGVRIELEEGKKDPVDFALWKSAKPGEIYWNSPWGNGRPGWHIECSAMALDTLGETIDIHGGGRDLLFPHHENEIAQSEALTGKMLAKYWTHCGLIKINGEKMSKSLGNSLTIRDALNMYNYEVIKYVMFCKHYASDMDILDSDFQLAENHMYYFYSTIKNMKEFIAAMDDDFNTAVVIANLHIIFKYANNIMKSAKKDNKNIVANTLKKILEDINEVYSGVLGLFEQQPEEFISNMKQKYLKKLKIDVNYIKSEIEKRAIAKKEKNFETADSIRAKLEKYGIILNDTKDGTTWDFKALYKID